MTTPLPELPTTRPTGCPFDPPTELAKLREEQPLRPLTFPDGHVGWLVTGHALARSVFADRRFSSRHELLRSPTAATRPGEIPPAQPGMFIGMDAPEHSRYRRLLAGRFTARRMRQLTERVEQITADCLAAMEQHGPPLDLVRAYAQPIPALMICELLGVPYADQEMFQRHSATLNNLEAGREEIFAAYGALQEYLHALVVAKRAEPTDDLLSDLAGEDLTEEELTNIGVLLLGAGLDTTANMLGLGTFALLRHPDQLAAWRADPGLTESAVEELLRYLTVAHTGVRTALEDVELDGHLIEAGQSVAIAMQAADRDPAKFPHPDVLDLRRDPVGHVAFGHGAHQCLGQQLARIEMRVAFPALLGRFPTLRLDIPAGEVPLRTQSDIYGVSALPVAWDADTEGS